MMILLNCIAFIMIALTGVRGMRGILLEMKSTQLTWFDAADVQASTSHLTSPHLSSPLLTSP